MASCAARNAFVKVLGLAGHEQRGGGVQHRDIAEGDRLRRRSTARSAAAFWAASPPFRSSSFERFRPTVFRRDFEAA